MPKGWSQRQSKFRPTELDCLSVRDAARARSARQGGSSELGGASCRKAGATSSSSSPDESTAGQDPTLNEFSGPVAIAKFPIHVGKRETSTCQANLGKRGPTTLLRVGRRLCVPGFAREGSRRGKGHTSGIPPILCLLTLPPRSWTMEYSYRAA